MKKFDSAKWITENKYGKIFEQEKDEKGEKEKSSFDPATITNQTSYGELGSEEDAKKILSQLQSKDPNQPIFKAMEFKDDDGKTVKPDPAK